MPDNTVLVNFARIGRMDLLRALVGANGRWCGTVADECNRSALQPDLESLKEAHEIFGDPLLPETPQEHVDTQVFRSGFARPGDGPTKHLGEAETIAIVVNRKLDASFVTDDEAAALRATEQGIRTYTTWHLIRLAIRVGLLPFEEAWVHVIALEGHKRKHYPQLHSKSAFSLWCTA